MGKDKKNTIINNEELELFGRAVYSARLRQKGILVVKPYTAKKLHQILSLLEEENTYNPEEENE